jgi:5'-nucleotidase
VIIVLTNDDGFDAPGLEALRRVLDPVARTVTVAPDRPQSGVGHRVTTKTPLRLVEAEPGRHRLDGTPADCARLALTRLYPEAEWLVSGINRGGNMGIDTFISGTVAAAREAAVLGKKAVSISQYLAPGGTVDWHLTGLRAAAALRRLLARPPGPGAFWNVNLPQPDHGGIELDMVFCELDPNPLDVRFEESDGGYIYAGNYQSRRRSPGTDVSVCFGGAVAVTRIRF